MHNCKLMVSIACNLIGMNEQMNECLMTPQHKNILAVGLRQMVFIWIKSKLRPHPPPPKKKKKKKKPTQKQTKQNKK